VVQEERAAACLVRLFVGLLRVLFDLVVLCRQNQGLVSLGVVLSCCLTLTTGQSWWLVRYVLCVAPNLVSLKVSFFRKAEGFGALCCAVLVLLMFALTRAKLAESWERSKEWPASS
jgi:hypothetical protein